MNEVENLKSIHYKCRDFLNNREYDSLVKYIQSFYKEANVNILKTILIITQSFKEHLVLKNVIEETQILFNDKMKQNGH